ncbi:MAG: hypothetical protein ACI4OR_01075 [Alphaproteobacteria bacterium]
MKAKDRIQEKDYKELSALVLGTVKQLNAWAQKEAETQRNAVGKFVSADSFKRYMDSLNALIKKIKEDQQEYQQTISKWDRTSIGWAKFPDTHEEYRKMIYELEDKKVSVMAEQERMGREKAAAQRAPASQKTASKAPVSKAPAPPKPNWWKRAVLGTALVAGGWFGAKQMNSNNGPEAGDKPTQAMEQRVTVTQQRQGYTLSATQTASGKSLLPRLQQSVDQSMANINQPMDNGSFNATVQGRWQRNVISGLDVQGSANQAAIAGNMARTAQAKRSINYEEQRMKVDTAESWEDVSRAVERTTGNLRGTIQQATDGVHALRDFGRAFRGKGR